MSMGKLRSIDVVVCTRDPDARLQRVLAHVADQAVPSGWERRTLLIDNCSSPPLARRRALAPRDVFEGVSIVSEDRPGLAFARERARRESEADVLLFVDDDNYLDSGYLTTVVRHFEMDPCLGVLGGCGRLPGTHQVPEAMRSRLVAYAVGDPTRPPGELSGRGWLYGAGLAVRRRAWDMAVEKGFSFSLTGRTGDRIASGEDVELVYAIRMAGWRGRFDPTLTFVHDIDPARLRPEELLKLAAASGAASPFLDPYLEALGVRPRLPRWLRRSWRARWVITAARGIGERLSARVSGDALEVRVDAAHRAGRRAALRQMGDRYGAHRSEVLNRLP